jgi:hypothetical protein
MRPAVDQSLLTVTPVKRRVPLEGSGGTIGPALR